MTDPNVPDRPSSPDDDPNPFSPYWEWSEDESEELEPTAGEGET